MSVCDLAQRIKANDPEAVTELYKRYHRLVRLIAFRIVGDDGLADDVVQEVFLRVWLRSSTIDTQKPISPWLNVLSSNLAIDHRRRSNRHPEAPLKALVRHPSYEMFTHRYDHVERCYGHLPREAQTLLWSAYHEGRSQSEIAASTGIPLGTLKTRMRTALGRMRQEMLSLEAG